MFKYLVVLQEDMSPWNSRLRTAQISFFFSQNSDLQTLLISVFTVFGRFRIDAKCAFVFLLWFVSLVSGPAYILCLSVANGCNKERRIP